MEPCNKCTVCNKLCEIVPAMAAKFKALGDLTRLQIIYLLATDTSGTLGVSELAGRLGISQPAVSQHLKTLKNEGLVDSRREGFYIYYTISRERIMEFRENFELMYASVMENCSRELVRKSTRNGPVRSCIIFYSHTGITRGIAESLKNSGGCDLIEVTTKKPYSSFTAYTTGVLRSRREACDEILPEEIDVSAYDLLIIGTPVWAWKPAPAINTAIRAIRGGEGKAAVIFTTCINHPGEALPIMRRALLDRGMNVVAEISLDAADTKSPDAGGELLRQIIAADPLRRRDGGAGVADNKKGEEEKES